MSSLPEHVHRVRDGSLHQLQAGLEAGPAHGLNRPFECGNRWWVKCRCGGLFSSDRESELPAICEFEQVALSAAAARKRIARVVCREWDELNRLLRRSA